MKKYKGTSHNPVYDASSFKTLYDLNDNSTISDLSEKLVSDNIEEVPEVVNYFKSYVNSEGYDRIMNNQEQWWEKRHPIRKWVNFNEEMDAAKAVKNATNKHNYPVFLLDFMGGKDFTSMKTNNAYVGRDNYTPPTFPYTFTVDFTLGHEHAHSNFPYFFDFPYVSAQKEALKQNTNTNLTEDEVSNKHDSREEEKWADLWGLKYLLYKEGIYDSRSTKNATPEHIKKLRKKYPKLRPLL